MQTASIHMAYGCCITAAITYDIGSLLGRRRSSNDPMLYVISEPSLYEPNIFLDVYDTHPISHVITYSRFVLIVVSHGNGCVTSLNVHKKNGWIKDKEDKQSEVRLATVVH